MNSQDTNEQDSKYFGDERFEKGKQVLTDGVAIAPYGPDCCLEDSEGNDIEETRGHVWRMAVEPDPEYYLDRDESFSLYVHVLDNEFPVEKAAYRRIREAADRLDELARKIETKYSIRTGDVVPCEQLASHTAVQLSRLMVEIVGGNASRYMIEFGDPRQEFCDHHNANSPDGSIARILPNPGPEIVPDMSFGIKKGTRFDRPHSSQELAEVAKTGTKGVTGPDQPQT